MSTRLEQEREVALEQVVYLEALVQQARARLANLDAALRLGSPTD